MEWNTERLVIWGETYPELSSSHRETVCTGAVRLDGPGLVRVYPLPLRYLPEDRRPKKWDVIEARIARTSSDGRPESYKIDADSIRVVGHIDTKNGWEHRRRLMLREEHFVTGLDDMAQRQAATGQSLGIIREARILDIELERVPEDERRRRGLKYDAILRQGNFLHGLSKPMPAPVFMPRIHFRTSESAKVHEFIVRDWELIELARKVEGDKNPGDAFNNAFFEIMRGREPYIIVGNINFYPKTFMCVALMYPTIQVQPSLF